MDYHTAFINILELLIPYGWQFIKTDVNEIIMNKKFYELEEITIQSNQSTNQSTTQSTTHFTVPIKNSVYSFYKKFSHPISKDDDEDEDESILFLDNYVHNLLV